MRGAHCFSLRHSTRRASLRTFVTLEEWHQIQGQLQRAAASVRKKSFNSPCSKDELQLCITLETPEQAPVWGWTLELFSEMTVDVVLPDLVEPWMEASQALLAVKHSKHSSWMPYSKLSMKRDHFFALSEHAIGLLTQMSFPVVGFSVSTDRVGRHPQTTRPLREVYIL